MSAALLDITDAMRRFPRQEGEDSPTWFARVFQVVEEEHAPRLPYREQEERTPGEEG